MCLNPGTYRFDQLHVDVARNSTDDFNPFHDPHRWHRVRDNPFGSPIVLGFQLEALVDALIGQQHQPPTHAAAANDPSSAFSNYEYRFVGALRPGEDFTAEIRRSERKTTDVLATRALLRKLDGSLILLANRSDGPQPRFLPEWSSDDLPPTHCAPDRTLLPGTEIYLKRKFLNTSNGKNFLLGALVDPFPYFDELTERVYFPPMFTAALVSCALLEKARGEGYDFEVNPMVYVAHQISVDCRLQAVLRSNDRIDILIDGPRVVDPGSGLAGSAAERQLYHCYGLVQGRRVLFRAAIFLSSLRAITGSSACRLPRFSPSTTPGCVCCPGAGRSNAVMAASRPASR